MGIPCSVPRREPRSNAGNIRAPDRAHAELDGPDVHAEVVVDGRDRKRRCRYVTRPPLALERFQEHEGGRIRSLFKGPWRDGTHAVVLEPFELLARLASLVPPPRFHLVRHHGVFAANATERARSSRRSQRREVCS